VSGHTPGPWAWVNSKTDQPFDFDAEWYGEGIPSLRTVAERRKTEGGYWELPDWIFDAEPMQHGNDAANARLIAAAPDLLEALQVIIKSLADQDDEGMIEHAQPMIDARAAIAKATGVQS
jgi:hypothetical protein